MTRWQERRALAHRQGRHVVPQVDCRRCWDSGAFDPINALAEDQRTDPAPRHYGQHAGCVVCSPVIR